MFQPVRDECPIFDFSIALILGSAVSSLGFLGVAYAGFAVKGAIALSILLVATAVLRRREVMSAAILVAAKSKSLLPSSRFERLTLIAVAIVLVIYAIAPPRDADVMRYHLAHIRQIADEGAWSWMPNVHYAIPFAWSINYLPFEIANLPQAAALLNAALWPVVFFLVLEAWSRRSSGRYPFLICLCFMAQPYVVKVFSAAFLDGYSILLTTVLAIGLTRVAHATRQNLIALGFVCFIGIASRYQLVAISITGTLIALPCLASERNWKGAGFFLVGCAIAIAVSSPYYIVNWIHAGNPVWPLTFPFTQSGASYLAEIGSSFIRAYSWPAILPLSFTTKRLFTDPAVAPLPIVLSLVSLVGLFLRRNEWRAVSLLSCGFLALWFAMSPYLYPSYIMPIVALGPLMVMSLIPEPRRLVTLILRSIAIVFISASFFFSWDHLSYDITGNKNEFHRYTWYYDVDDWVNHNTPPESRVVVIVYSGMSYYLDRFYRKADPWLAAEIDWSKVESPAALDSIMQHGGYDYLIYDDRDWSMDPGGERMSSIVHSAASSGVLIPVHRSVEKLYSGRVTRRFTTTNVLVYKRAARYSLLARP